MVRFDDGLIITNYHPVLYQGEWKFPVDVKNPQNIFVDCYYNFVLEAGHSMLVNSVPCITLGHGLKGPVVEHEYLGTDRILKDLELLEGWKQGEVLLNMNMVKRDPRTNLIVGINKTENLIKV
jgi:hypothetical protein